MQINPHQNDKEIVDYWTKAATPSGKARLQLRVKSKRFAWNLVLAASLGLKRAIDIVASGCALLLLSPVYALTALLIKLEDRGPVFFKQERIGYRGTSFYMWKFRSMVVDADALKDQLLGQNEHSGNNITFKMKRDPRITRIGRFIRKYSVDELPQFWNVFKGEMSIVGPRPCVPREVVMYTVEDRKRLLAKPGLTCFWQVAGRANINFEGQVRLDVEYIRSESVWLDIKLLLKTVPAVLLGKGAY